MFNLRGTVTSLREDDNGFGHPAALAGKDRMHHRGGDFFIAENLAFLGTELF